MAFNKDIHSLFDKYVQNILEQTAPADTDPRFKKAVAAWEKMTEQLTGTRKIFSQLPPEQRNSISRQFLRPAMESGYLVHPRTGQKFPIYEAVIPTEEGGPFDPTAAAAKRQELLKQRGQEVVNQANARRINPSTQQGQAALANQQTQQQQAQQTQQQQRQQQQAQSAASLAAMQTPGAKTFGSTTSSASQTTSNPNTVPATKSQQNNLLALQNPILGYNKNSNPAGPLLTQTTPATTASSNPATTSSATPSPRPTPTPAAAAANQNSEGGSWLDNFAKVFSGGVGGAPGVVSSPVGPLKGTVPNPPAVPASTTPSTIAGTNAPTNVSDLSKFGQIQRLRDISSDAKNPSFTEFQDQNRPTQGPTTDAAKQQTASQGQKFVQATTGNAPTNTGAATPAEIARMKKLHGSFDPKSSTDRKKLDMLRQAEQELGPNAKPEDIRNKAYALQSSASKSKPASAALPGAGQKPGQLKTQPKPATTAPSAPATNPVPNQTVQNSALPGIFGTASNMLGRIGDTAENIAKGQAGTGAQSRIPVATRAKPTQTSQATKTAAKPTQTKPAKG